MVRLLFPCWRCLLIQTFLFAGNIWYGGTIEELNNNSVDLLEKRVFSRKNYLQNEMIQKVVKSIKIRTRYSNCHGFYLEEKEITLSTLKQEPHLAFEFWSERWTILSLLRQRMVTGAFIVLTGENEKSIQSIY